MEKANENIHDKKVNSNKYYSKNFQLRPLHTINEDPNESINQSYNNADLTPHYNNFLEDNPKNPQLRSGFSQEDNNISNNLSYDIDDYDDDDDDVEYNSNQRKTSIVKIDDTDPTELKTHNDKQHSVTYLTKVSLDNDVSPNKQRHVELPTVETNPTNGTVNSWNNVSSLKKVSAQEQYNKNISQNSSTSDNSITKSQKYDDLSFSELTDLQRLSSTQSLSSFKRIGEKASYSNVRMNTGISNDSSTSVMTSSALSGKTLSIENKSFKETPQKSKAQIDHDKK